MSYNPATGFPRIMPSLRYDDVGGVLAWLARAFGLTEHLRWTDGGGVVRHAEMRIDQAFIELPAAPEGCRNPRRIGAVRQSLPAHVAPRQEVRLGLPLRPRGEGRALPHGAERVQDVRAQGAQLAAARATFVSPRRSGQALPYARSAGR